MCVCVSTAYTVTTIVLHVILHDMFVNLVHYKYTNEQTITQQRKCFHLKCVYVYVSFKINTVSEKPSDTYVLYVVSHFQIQRWVLTHVFT